MRLNLSFFRSFILCHVRQITNYKGILNVSHEIEMNHKNEFLEYV